MCTPTIKNVSNDPEPPRTGSLATVEHMQKLGSLNTSLGSPSQLERTQISAKRVTTYHGYGSFAGFESDARNNPCAQNSNMKANWSCAKCIPRLSNVFAHMREEILHRDRRVPRYLLDAKDHEWFCVELWMRSIEWMKTR